MMKNSIKLLLLVLILVACTKYPENPTFDFTTKKLGGTLWELKSVTINSIDSTNNWNHSDSICWIAFEQERDKGVFSGNCRGAATMLSKEWRFGNRSLIFEGRLLSPEVTQEVEFEILKFYKEELKLRINHPMIRSEFVFQFKKRK
jgi:hypothetical protein